MAQVGEHAEVARAVGAAQLQRLARIVRHGEGLDAEVADLDVACRRAPSCSRPSKIVRRRWPSQVPSLIHTGIRVAARQRTRAADVVAVLVGDEDGVDVAGREARRRPAAHRGGLQPKPQSISSREVRPPLVASTSVALPVLPLPRLRKRSIAGLTSGRRR